mmetsp:Transcript_8356/g.18186  ORF Transcript_8356/g.18186 Transcript_8356/m.18186 type:complete len:219 (-) Transcript_8356:1950-2606(-)
MRCPRPAGPGARYLLLSAATHGVGAVLHLDVIQLIGGSDDNSSPGDDVVLVAYLLVDILDNDGVIVIVEIIISVCIRLVGSFWPARSNYIALFAIPLGRIIILFKPLVLLGVTFNGVIYAQNPFPDAFVGIIIISATTTVLLCKAIETISSDFTAMEVLRAFRPTFSRPYNSGATADLLVGDPFAYVIHDIGVTLFEFPVHLLKGVVVRLGRKSSVPN